MNQLALAIRHINSTENPYITSLSEKERELVEALQRKLKNSLIHSQEIPATDWPRIRTDPV